MQGAELSIYPELEITKVSDVLQYLLRIWSFMRVFSLEYGKVHLDLQPWKSFLNLFQSKMHMQLYLMHRDCLATISNIYQFCYSGNSWLTYDVIFSSFVFFGQNIHKVTNIKIQGLFSKKNMSSLSLMLNQQAPVWIFSEITHFAFKVSLPPTNPSTSPLCTIWMQLNLYYSPCALFSLLLS